MSHFTKLQTKIADPETLVSCLERMGLEVREAGIITGYQGNRQAVEIIAHMPVGYDIGFVRNAEGYYDVVADWWGVKGTDATLMRERLEQEMIALQNEIRREYAAATVIKEVQNQGFEIVKQETDEDGRIRILARR